MGNHAPICETHARTKDQIDVENIKRSFEEVQARKSTRGMPWHWEPKKDVTSCEKPRGGANSRYIRGYPNGETPHIAIYETVY